MSESIQAVIFDWRGTLVTELSPAQWAAEALRRTGRPAQARDALALLRRINAAAGQPNRLQSPDGNTSRARHLDTYLSVFADAHLDDDLAHELVAVDSDPDYNRLAKDAPGTLRALWQAGVKIGVLSNIHFDIRPEFAAAGLLELIDAFALSCELGIQKPDPEIFRVTAGLLNTPVERTLMVGDRPARDGVAVEAGMVTILVPSLRDPQCCRLGPVTAAAGLAVAP